MEQVNLFERFKKFWISGIQGRFSLDISRCTFGDDFLAEKKAAMQRALSAMQELEKGAIANPDEKRMVGHYWLRTPELAPSVEIRTEIESTLKDIEQFAAAVHAGRIAPPSGGRFRNVLVIGIGGSALGPQFMNHALRTGREPLAIFFLDNTDPDGIARVLSNIPDLSKTLTVVISKSGGTKETRNGQLLTRAAYEAEGIAYGACFVAVTGKGSELDLLADRERWLKRFPMWDWVGGRTSEWSAVGCRVLIFDPFCRAAQRWMLSPVRQRC
jgi:glucose-6-phosphate isomerase